MTYEENERLTRIENQIEHLVNIQGMVGNTFEKQGHINLMTGNLILNLTNSQIALWRFLATSPLFPEGDGRREVLNHIARFESLAERWEAGMAQIKKQQEKFPPTFYQPES